MKFFLAMDTFFKPAAGLKLRREHFGGIAFNAETGLFAELDRAAFRMLALVAENGIVSEAGLLGLLASPGSVPAARKVLDSLVDLGLLVRCGDGGELAEDYPAEIKGPSSPPRFIVSGEKRLSPHCLQAPATVHWAVTGRCHSRCPDCYARRHYTHNGHGEMDTGEALAAVAALAEWGVFQLAIGGGEPFLRPDLADIAGAAAQSGMIVHVTTGMTELPVKTVEKLSPAVKVLQFNIDEHRLVEHPVHETTRLRRELQKAAASGLKTGANLKVSKTTLANFKTILDRLEESGFTSITLLRYKPPPSLNRWLAENPSPRSLLALELFLAEAASDLPQLSFRVDCAFSFLFRHLDPRKAYYRGIRGCAAARRIAALDPQGYLLPCSQLAGPRFRAGNILEEQLSLIWQESKVFKKYRFFREKSSFKQSRCGICRAVEHCGGCRVFAPNALGADPNCPEPLLPPLKLLGKKGRKVDLKDYMKGRVAVSVEEYMERYGVGLKTAVRELRSCLFLSKTDPGPTGKEKNDCYTARDDDLVAFIQDSIGYTSGGLPVVSNAEICSWLEKEDPEHKYKGYPRWLIDEDWREFEEED